MPIRLVCPSCSAALSVKDEYAGRAVKCPKCGGVIPASGAAAVPPRPAPPPPEPPPAPAGNPFEVLDEPAAGPPKGGRITGRPGGRSPDRDDRPPRRRDRDRDDAPDDRGGDDRPRRRRRPDGPDRGDGGDGVVAKASMSVGVIIALVFGALVLCCGAPLAAGYYFFARTAEAVRDGADAFQKKLEEDAKRREEEMKAESGPPIEVRAADLAKEFKDDKAAAEGKYKNRTVLVEGKLDDISYGFDGEAQALLVGQPPPEGKILGTLVRVVMTKADANKLLGVSRGQTVKLRGKCTGQITDLFVDAVNGTVEGTGADPNPTVTAAELLAEHARGADATDDRYKDKPITITNAVVVRKDGEASLIVGGPGKKGTAVTIKVNLPLDAKKQIANLKAGERVKVKGEYSSTYDNMININRAWIVP